MYTWMVLRPQTTYFLYLNRARWGSLDICGRMIQLKWMGFIMCMVNRARPGSLDICGCMVQLKWMGFIMCMVLQFRCLGLYYHTVQISEAVWSFSAEIRAAWSYISNVCSCMVLQLRGLNMCLALYGAKMTYLDNYDI